MGAISPRILVLGSAAGGGLPQWNCGCANCDKARRGAIPARTQSSIAICADGREWAIINASPDIRQQIIATPALHPRGLRHSPIRTVVVTNGDIDHIAGLLTLRESQPFTIHATRGILTVIEANPIFAAVDRALVPRRGVELHKSFELLPDVEAEFFAVPGKVPLYMEAGQVRTDVEGEQTVGLRLTVGESSAFYIPGCARMTPSLAQRLRGASLLLFDGTVFEDDEMIRLGVGNKTGARMGHMAIAGPCGSLAAFTPLDVRRKVFVHINNTNPILDPESPARAAVEAAGWEVAEDGMELRL